MIGTFAGKELKITSNNGLVHVFQYYENKKENVQSIKYQGFSLMISLVTITPKLTPRHKNRLERIKW